MLTAVIVILAIVLIGIIVYAVRSGVISRKKMVENELPEELDGESEEMPEEDPDADPEAEEEEPLTDLVDYYEDREPTEEEPVLEEEPAVFDKLSNLKKGRSYILDCENMMARARQSGDMVAVASLDIDRFRFINSIKGYSLGDYVLSRLAQELRSVFPVDSLFSRVSADHFFVVFPIPDNHSFDIYDEEIRKSCSKIRNDVGIKSALKVCMGIAVTDPSSSATGYNVRVLMAKADIARHCLKIARAESWLLYDESMISSWLYGESAQEDYRENQYGDEFVLYFQTITELSKNNPAGCDALVRWTCEDDTALAPVTPDDGRLPTNNAKVLYHVCRAMSRWRKAGKEVLPTYMYINATDFFKKDLDELFTKCITEFQLEPGMLYAVVDMSVLRVDWTLASHQIKRLNDIGVRTGVSGVDVSVTSLDSIAGLGLHFIKLHKSFVHEIHKSEEQVDNVRRILALAQAQNLRVIFEGVNSLDQSRILQKLGVELAEGKYSGTPMLPEEFGRGLSEYVANKKTHGDETVILDEFKFNQGDVTIF